MGGDDADNETAATAVAATVVALAIICVALRFYSRHMTGTGFKWDDWLSLLALVGTIASDVLVLVG